MNEKSNKVELEIRTWSMDSTEYISVWEGWSCIKTRKDVDKLVNNSYVYGPETIDIRRTGGFIPWTEAVRLNQEYHRKIA